MALADGTKNKTTTPCRAIAARLHPVDVSREVSDPFVHRTGSEMAEESKVLERLSLYSSEAIRYLEEAIRLAETAAPRVVPSPYISRYSDSSSEEEDVNPDEESDSDDHEDHQAATDDKVENSAEPSTDGTSSTSATSVPEKPTMTDRQRDAEYRKHVESLSCFQLPLAEDRCLGVPRALLSKDENLSHDTLSIAKRALELAQSIRTMPLVVFFVRSGRFAGAVFKNGNCTEHRVRTRYTVRKGQGKAQSAQDSQRRAKSMGSQLRRAGEQQLKEDMTSAALDWQDDIRTAALIFVACPKTMRKSLFDSMEEVLSREDPRIRRVPLDLDRPSFESVSLIHDVLASLLVREVVPDAGPVTGEPSDLSKPTVSSAQDDSVIEKKSEIPKVELNDWHVAARDGDTKRLHELLFGDLYEANHVAGPELMTPLHYAASSTENSVDAHRAHEIVYRLLVEAKADPGVVDARNRPPYYLATHDKVRDAFRMARAEIGEDAWDWDGLGKVGPPLSTDDLERRKEKEAEKKRRKRARQKEKKAKEKE